MDDCLLMFLISSFKLLISMVRQIIMERKKNIFLKLILEI